MNKIIIYVFISLSLLIYSEFKILKIESEFNEYKISESNNISNAIEEIDKHLKNNFFLKTPEDGLMDALIFYELKHPQIVFAQAKLESNLGKSNLYERTNNLFGLYDSRNKKYHQFEHWSQSVLGYKNMIQYKYKDDIDYYDFLNKLGYAEDKNYNKKLKIIVNSL